MGRFRTSSNAYARAFGLRPVPYRPRWKRPPLTGLKKGARPRLGMRVRRGSRTQARMRRRLYGTGKRIGPNSSMSFFRFGRRWMSRFVKMLYKKVQSRQVDCFHTTATASSGTGQQGIHEWSSLKGNELIRLKTTANRGVTTDNNIRLFIGHVKRRMLYRNQTNTVCKLTLYEIVYKRQASITTIDEPNESWAKGYTDFLLTNQHLEVGNTPFNSPEFRTYFYVKKVIVVNLEPGQQHEHTVIHRINRIVDSTMWDQSQSIFQKDLTSWTMAVFHGSLGHESATPSTISYVPITLDMSCHSEIHFGFIEQNQPGYRYTAAIPKTVADFDFMGEADDVDASNITA